LPNTSERPVGFSFLPPEDLFRLVVRRDGELILPRNPRRGRAWITLAWVTLKPHIPRSITAERWLPITDWGYALQEPGRYTIETIPVMMDQSFRHLVQDTLTIRSNQATFTIGP
jgi:hypothetical protein